jgi:hypothetical protein
MFEWLRRLCCGSSAETKPAASTDINLAAEGYSPKFIDQRVREVRGTLIDMQEHARVVADSGADKDGQFAIAAHRARTSIEKVLQNLKKDPEDLSRMGLALESLKPLNKLLETTARYAATGVDDKKLDNAIKLSLDGLNMTADKFDKLMKGPLQLDDEIQLKGLSKTVADLNK